MDPAYGLIGVKMTTPLPLEDKPPHVMALLVLSRNKGQVSKQLCEIVEQL